MKWYLKILFLSTCLMLTACDFRYRYSDSGVSEAELQEYVGNMINSLSANGNTVRQMYEDPATYFYFAHWSREDQYMGPLEAVAPIDWNSVVGQNINPAELQMVKIYFFHKLYDDLTSDDALVIEYQVNGSSPQYQYYSSTNASATGSSVDGVFQTLVSSSGITLTLESYDVLDDDLDVDIQLKIYTEDNQTFLGKFSNLEGFPL